MKRVLIANRGEIAVRIARTACEKGLVPVLVHPEDDSPFPAGSGDWLRQPISGRGVTAYLNHEQVLQAASSADCDAIHPGYGFLRRERRVCQRRSRKRTHIRRPCSGHARALW